MSTSTSGKLRPIWLGLLGLVSVVLLYRYAQVTEQIESFNHWIGSLGPWGPLVFGLAYVLATVFLIPGSALTLGAGALFGVVWGSVCVSVASTVGASAAFLLARYGFRQRVERSIEGRSRFRAISQAVSAKGWQVVLLTRLSPILPFTFLNYAFGLSRIGFRDYLTASWLGMLPGTVMYVYVGAAAKQATTGVQAGHWRIALFLSGLVATIAVAALVARMAKKILDRQLAENSH